MSCKYFLKIFLQINILSAVGTFPLTVHAQAAVAPQSVPPPTPRQLPSTGSAIALPPVPKTPAHPPHPPAPSADHLGAIFDTESISSLLNRNDDALRRSDLTAGYYVPAEAFGHIAPQLSPYRNWLAERGFSFEFSYKGEAMANVGGGISKGMSYAHELTFNTRWDLGKLLGLDGWILHAVMMERAGREVSYDHVGEHHVLLSEVYSLSGHAAAHLADIYLEKSFFNNRLNINIGRITLTHTYATSVLLCTFMVQCSAPPAIKADEGWSVYPKANWGGTLRFKPTRDLTLRTGVYRVGALTENPSGWAWGSEHSTGVMLPID